MKGEMSDEDREYLGRVLDRAGVRHSVTPSARTRRTALERRQRIEAAVGLPLATGPDIVSGVFGLPEGSPDYVMAVGLALLVRAALTQILIWRNDL